MYSYLLFNMTLRLLNSDPREQLMFGRLLYAINAHKFEHLEG